MRRAVTATVLAACLAVPAAAQMHTFSAEEIKAAKADPDKYTVDEASIQLESLGPVVSPTDILPPPPSGGQDVIPVLNEILNLGQRLWAIIEANRPVVDVQNTYASALPKGLAHWGDLGGWELPKGTAYQLTANNMYGMKMINVKFTILRTTGGSYNGKGKYLTAVTVEPLLVEVGSGYRLDLTASVPDSSITNVGTTADPVAAMMPTLTWRIRTVIKDSQGKGLYYVTGDGKFRELAGPFKRDSLGGVARSLSKELNFDR